MKQTSKTLREFNSRRKLDLINRAAFYLLLGAIFTELIYWVAAKRGMIEIIIK